jgi:hypothetical protein
MLNKINQKKKLMEVCHHFACSVAFMFLFQVEVVAQEKVQNTTTKLQTDKFNNC